MRVQTSRDAFHRNLQCFGDLTAPNATLAKGKCKQRILLSPLQASGCSAKLLAACRLSATYLIPCSGNDILDVPLCGLLSISPQLLCGWIKVEVGAPDVCGKIAAKHLQTEL